jgi:hypothetical protein
MQRILTAGQNCDVVMMITTNNNNNNNDSNSNSYSESRSSSSSSSSNDSEREIPFDYKMLHNIRDEVNGLLKLKLSNCPHLSLPLSPVSSVKTIRSRPVLCTSTTPSMYPPKMSLSAITVMK